MNQIKHFSHYALVFALLFSGSKFKRCDFYTFRVIIFYESTLVLEWVLCRCLFFVCL